MEERPAHILREVQLALETTLTVFLAIVASVAAIMVVPEIRAWMRLDKPALVVLMERITNARFGFSFAHPDTWDRVDPANGDGYSFVDPKDPQTRVLGWGQFIMEPENHFTICELVADKTRRLEQRGAKIIESHPKGLHAFTWHKEDGSVVETREEIEGWRFRYRMKDDGRKIIVHELCTIRAGIEFGFAFQTTERRYRDLEDLAIALLNRFRILADQGEQSRDREESAQTIGT